jgi:MFS transporter, PPP family, 3-phenylpropionic acid transporter
LEIASRYPNHDKNDFAHPLRIFPQLALKYTPIFYHPAGLSMSLFSSQPNSRRGLIVVWLMYFFYFGAIGLYFPFLNIFYLQNGLTGTEIGLVNTCGAAVGVLFASLWGYLGDRVRSPRLLLAIGALVCSLILQANPFVHGFWPYLLLNSASGLINAGLVPLIDNLTLGLLGNRSEEYGRYRMGGSVGYILTTAFAGLVYQRVGLQWMFLCFGLFMIGFIISALLLPPATAHPENQEHKGIGNMIRQPVWLIFAAAVFLTWIAASGMLSYLGVAIKSLGGDDGLVGLCVSLGALTEIPFMLFSGRWIRRFGTSKVLWFAVITYAARMVLYAVMPVPTWAIFIGMLNGPTYVLFWSSAVNYARQLAPAGYQATAQGLMGSVTNLAGVVSALFCGYLFEQAGARGMFWVLAACCVLGFAIFGVGKTVRNKPVGN